MSYYHSRSSFDFSISVVCWVVVIGVAAIAGQNFIIVVAIIIKIVGSGAAQVEDFVTRVIAVEWFAAVVITDC